MDALPEPSNPAMASPTPMIDRNLMPLIGQKKEKAVVEEYVRAIIDPLTAQLHELQCASDLGQRYNGLRIQDPKVNKIQYLFALDLCEAIDLLPQLLGTIARLVAFLGREACAVSIVEGPSTDQSFEVLAAVQTEMEKQGTKFFLHSNTESSRKTLERIAVLARLRNLALAPMVDKPGDFHAHPLIIFANDVALCPEDVLELIYQHRYQNATMTCAFDWQDNGTCYYDSWVGRSMSGNLFFEMPPRGSSTQFAGDLFWDHPQSRIRFDRGQPIQVYSCWNGLVTIEGRPFLDRSLAFRASHQAECYNSEAVNLAKDMWRMGIGKIAAIPSVNVGYSSLEALAAKEVRGYVTDHVDLDQPEDLSQTERITWQGPPRMVKCIYRDWGGQYWLDPF